MSYATVEQLRAYLKQAKEDAETTATLEAILERSSAFVDGEIGHTWGTPAAGTRTLYGDGTSYLQLPADFVADSVTAVTTISGYTVPSYVEQDGMLIVTDSEGRIPYLGTLANTLYGVSTTVTWGGSLAVWTRGIPYTVAATFGYGAAPADLVEVVLEVAAYIWKNKDTAFSTVIGVEGGGAVNIRSSITPLARSILDHYTADSTSAGVW